MSKHRNYMFMPQGNCFQVKISSSCQDTGVNLVFKVRN